MTWIFIALILLADTMAPIMIYYASLPRASPQGVNCADPCFVFITRGSITPQDAVIVAGTQVIWQNSDNITNNVISSTGAFASDSLGPGASFPVTFLVPGTYSYSDTLHPAQGKITVLKAPPSM